MRPSESSGLLWISTDDEAADAPGQNAFDDGDAGRGPSLESEEEEEDAAAERQRLIRTVPSIDWFDVEGNEVAGADREEGGQMEMNFGRVLVLALQTLAVVFGDIGISPLYTFDVMFNKCPIRGEEDILGALSLVLYTLILIPLVKYVMVVLWGNDDGEGGTCALYSLICRNANVSLIPNVMPMDTRHSSIQLRIPTAELERALKIKECLESSLLWKFMLLGLVLFGSSMVISDGVVTPAMSVMSAVRGLKVGISDFSQDIVVMIAIALLVFLFSIQRYATSKVGFVLGPLLLLWFISLGGFGIYNLARYGATAFKAFNPLYILYYFERNSYQAWLALAGCLLCATGSEAIFADLCYFPLRYVQFTFVLLVLPCLLLGYLGQAAFLIANQNSSEQLFFRSLPEHAFWPVFLIANIAAMIASRTMVTATFSCIKKSIALGCFPRLKIVHTSRKFMGQIYIPVINWFLLATCLIFILCFGGIYEFGNAYAVAEAGVMMMTTILITIIMLLIWQIHILKVACFVVVFLGLELMFFLSALSSIGDGSWGLIVFSAAFFIMMYVWNYGSQLKYECEIKQKLSRDLLMELGPNLGTIRAPGIGLVCTEIVKGVPAIFGHFLTSLPAMYSIIVIVCIRQTPVSVVPQSERFIFQRVCPRSYHMFRCIARYGYKDVRKEHHTVFEKLLIDGLENFIRREAVELSLQSDDDFDSDEDINFSASRIVAAPDGRLYSLDAPLLAEIAPNAAASSSDGGSTSGPKSEPTADYTQNLELELAFIRKGRQSGAVYLVGNGAIKARKDSWFFRKLAINYFYTFLRNNCRRGITTLSIPRSNLFQVGMTYSV